MTRPDSGLDPLMAFAVTWEPYGGASTEDVFVEFGIDMSEYRRRLFVMLCRSDRGGVRAPLRDRLIAYSITPARRSPSDGR
ncbi:MAG: hypothetical protein NTX68_00300 [Rhodococcus sp.]|nr:hypothetical protein [Rhodococcus sp. (in: high G+C Gram-positive bacteria)]MCX6489414.1 hypothetical protein [Rhodococcus sp. (in: high G+C Gram-positive bacteria)]